MSSLSRLVRVTVTMSKSTSRLSVFRNHLCCGSSSSSSRNIHRSPARKSLDSLKSHTTINPVSVQSTLNILQHVTDTSANKPADSSLTTVMSAYTAFDNQQKEEFLFSLARDYQCDGQTLSASIDNLRVSRSAPNYKQQQRLRDNLVAPYEVIFREIGSTKSGVKFLVDLRRDLISFVRRCTDTEKVSSLQAMNFSLKQLLSLWFGVGFLNLERITWKSPCDLLEKVADYEGVHPVRNVTDLRTRVGPYRRCYAFLHPSMPGEPLVVLHVALVDGISSSIQAIVRHPALSNQSDFSKLSQASQYYEEDNSSFDAAVFYSITSTQPGLQGIDLGNYLIKTVVRELQSELPHLTHFSSLSPTPGFRDWVLTEINQELGGHQTQPLLSEQTIRVLSDVLKCENPDSHTVLIKLKQTLQDGSWAKDAQLVSGLENVLMTLCARYLYVEKHRSNALNSVANFHLRNGATLWRVNYMANSTAKGLMESCGLMVNYRYYLKKTIQNSQQYQQDHVIDADQQVLRLLN